MAYQPVPNEAVGMSLFFLFYILIGVGQIDILYFLIAENRLFYPRLFDLRFFVSKICIMQIYNVI